MTDWGPTKYGDPCRDCGFDWGITQADASALILDLPSRFREILDGYDATVVHPDLTWSSAAYVAHVSDNLRIFAERFASLSLGEYSDIFPYDPDVLAEARHYEAIPLEGALWSLGHAGRGVLEAIAIADAKGVTLQINDRGPQNVLELIRTITHDANHHLWDVMRTVDLIKAVEG